MARNMNTIHSFTHCDTLQADYEQYTDWHEVYTLWHSTGYEQGADRHEVYTLWQATGWLWTIYWPAQSLHTMNKMLTSTMSLHCDKPQADYEQYTNRHKVYTLWTRCWPAQRLYIVTSHRLTMNNILTGTKSTHYKQDADRHSVFTLWQATGWLWTVYWPAHNLYTDTLWARYLWNLSSLSYPTDYARARTRGGGGGAVRARDLVLALCFETGYVLHSREIAHTSTLLSYYY